MRLDALCVIGCGEHEHYSIKIFQSLVVEEALECRDSTCKVGSMPTSEASQSSSMIGKHNHGYKPSGKDNLSVG